MVRSAQPPSEDGSVCQLFNDVQEGYGDINALANKLWHLLSGKSGEHALNTVLRIVQVCIDAGEVRCCSSVAVLKFN